MKQQIFADYVRETLGSLLERFGYRFMGGDEVHATFFKGSTSLTVGRELGSNAVDLIFYPPTRAIGYSLPEIAEWADVDVPSLKARDGASTIAVLQWLARFIESHCAALLDGNPQAIHALDEAAAEHNRRYHNAMLLKSARSRAGKAFERGNFAQVVDLLSGLESELTADERVLLREAEHRSRG